jgi:hypothetical protein
MPSGLCPPNEIQGLTREECLAKAQECRDLAKMPIADPSHAEILEAMAQSWEQMANDYRVAVGRSGKN